MRVLIVALCPLAGCAPIAAGVVVGSIPVLHRLPTDVLVSVAAGRDCSIVHIDAGESYCRPSETPPAPPLFCTRSLGVADCWAEPAKLPNSPRETADGPRTLTPDQQEERVKWWRLFW